MRIKILLTIFVFLLSFTSKAQKTNAQPNIVVILSDDVGLGDISGYRKQHSNNIIVQTPEIDKLMSDGMHFTDAHSPTALCAPSRYSIMTGNNTYRSYAPWGVWGSYQETPVTDLSLGKLMKRAGYNTAFFGKWHLGGDYYRKNQAPTIYRAPRVAPELEVDVTQIVGGGPEQQGFDYSFMYPAGIQDVPYVVFENSKWYPLKNDSFIDHITQEKMDLINVTLDKDEGLGDSRWNPFDMGPLLANKAVDYINENAGKPNPFFMYYCTQAVHKPHTPPDMLDGKVIKGSTPLYHLDMIAELDAQMGMLVKALKEKGVYENTIFIFTSDNGGLTFNETIQTGHRPSDIYRGGKNQIYEGGHRVPFIATWPAKIPANSASNQLASVQDIMSTIAAAGNETVSDDEAKDSFNLLPIMLGEANPAKRDFLMIQGGTGRKVAYRQGNWKLIMQVDNQDQRIPKELYNLNSSPGENNNVLNSNGSRVAQMLAKYNQIRDSKIPTRTLHGENSDDTEVPIGETIFLRKAGGDTKIISVDNQQNNNQLLARASTNENSESFIVEPHPKGGVALKSLLNDKYIRVFDKDINIPIRAEATAKGDWTQFIWKSMGNGKVALKSVHADKWVQANWNVNNAVLYPKGEQSLDWETFLFEKISGSLGVQEVGNLEAEIYQGLDQENLELNVNFPITGDAMLDVYDITGKNVYSHTYQIVTPGIRKIPLNTGQLGISKKGIFLFKIKINNREKVIKSILYN